ncbi:efflux RND transporter periplasmic adaptor subunit [Sulfurirhabdus autotrophica]|nr:efflux RND transporter periplasmic adaptor subunit [Sulfurirhabdus autotrophica]
MSQQFKRLFLLLLFVMMAAGLGACGKPQENPGKTAPAVKINSSQSVRIIAEGRVVTYPGAEIVVSAEQSGVVVKLPVDEKMSVKKGDLIAELETDELRAMLAESRAKIREAEATLQLAKIEVERYKLLFQKQMGTKQNLDRAVHDHKAALARLATAQAAARRIQVSLDKSRILSPIDGVIITRYTNPGEMVAPGTHLVMIADLSKMRVEAEVDEFDVGRIVTGAKVQITAEGYVNQSWQGKVEEIPDAVVDRRLKPQDPGRPSDTRVLLVKIALLEPTPLKLGQRVEVEMQGKALAR